MADYFWTAFEWGEYLKDTTKLTLAQHGAYLLLMAEYYQTGKPLQAIASDLLRVCRAFDEAERTAVMFVLDRYFVLDGSVYRHKRIDEELSKASQLSEKRRDAGKKGVEAKRNKRRANAIANNKQLLTQSQLQLQKKNPPPTPLGNPEQILAIAKAYPKHDHFRDETEIPHAMAAAIVEAVEKDGYEKVLAGTKGYAAKLDNPEFAKRPDAFFSGFHYRQYVSKETVRKKGEIPLILQDTWNGFGFSPEKQKELYAEIIAKTRPN